MLARKTVKGRERKESTVLARKQRKEGKGETARGMEFSFLLCNQWWKDRRRRR